MKDAECLGSKLCLSDFDSDGSVSMGFEWVVCVAIYDIIALFREQDHFWRFSATVCRWHQTLDTFKKPRGSSLTYFTDFSTSYFLTTKIVTLLHVDSNNPEGLLLISNAS